MKKDENRNVKHEFCSTAVVAMLSLSMLIVVMAPVVADPGWLAGWSYREPVNISSSSELSNYQVLVTVDTASLILAGKMKADGGDIRFTDSDGTTLLNYWIESGINTASTKIWVKVPSVPTGETTIYMYYGNLAAASDSDYDNAFTKDYGETGLAGLWHFDDGTTPTADSSSNGNDGAVHGASWVGSDGGQWDGQDVQFSTGNSLSFDGVNDYVSVNNDPSLRITGPITLEAWVNFDSFGSSSDFKGIVAKWCHANEGGSGWGYGLFKTTMVANRIAFHLASEAGAGNTWVVSNNVPSLHQWYHVVGTYDGTNMRLYINGTPQTGTATIDKIYDNSEPVTIGMFEPNNNFWFNGTIDEARIYNRALSLDEIKCHYERRKYADPEPGVTIGDEEEPSQQPIPEFSTIAIPVVSILGLLFLFNYRKRRRN